MMKLSRKTRFLNIQLFTLACVITALTRITPVFAVDESSCVVCHSDIAVQHKMSKHASVGITCVSCHGGNPTDPDASSMSAANGFKGTPAREKIPEFCGRCHSDNALMFQYGLNTDQVSQYFQGAHGKALLQGDKNVAVCTDCHEKHKILPPDNPNSSTSSTKIAETCGKCHANKVLMGYYGLPFDINEKYEKSVHSKPRQGTKEKAANCAACHGNHVNKAPTSLETSNICSRCHTKIMNLIDMSPHKGIFAAGQMSCSNCHGAHEIIPAFKEPLEKSCSNCHTLNSEQIKIASKISTMIVSTREHLKSAQDTLNTLESKGHYVSDLKGRLEEANMGIQSASRDMHVLNPDAVNNSLVVTEAVVDEVKQAESKFAAQVLVRKQMLVPLWIYIGLMSLLLYRKRRLDE